MNIVYLSRKNLLDLLSKLDAAKEGIPTNSQINKHDVKHPDYPCSDHTKVIAIEDEEYYKYRNPGSVVRYTPEVIKEAKDALQKLNDREYEQLSFYREVMKSTPKRIKEL